MPVERWDVAVVGGGLVGLATAVEVAGREPERRVVLLEKEAGPARHQSGRNSGVVHSGIYYAPGSAKARLCVEGGRRLAAFCAERGVPRRVVGKVVVAVEPGEVPALDELHRRGEANGVEELARLDASELLEVEPHVRGLAGLHVPGVSVVDYRAVAAALAEKARELGVELRTGARVRGAARAGDAWSLAVAGGALCARRVVTCAGLQSDRVARVFGARPRVRVLPFRGEYYTLRPEAAALVRGLIYPVPDPRFPFLGVHFTRRVGGEVEAGPNAVPALAREGYRWSDVAPLDVAGALTWPGTWRLALRHASVGWAEIRRSLDRRAFARALQRLVPEVRAEDLVPAPAGVRAQAVDRSGRLVDDFEFHAHEGALHVLNAPSPAATACLAIASEVADRLEEI